MNYKMNATKLTLSDMLKSARLSAHHQYTISTGNALAELLLTQSSNENKDPSVCFQELFTNYMKNGDTFDIYEFINILEYSTTIAAIINKAIRQDVVHQLKYKRAQIILRYELE